MNIYDLFSENIIMDTNIKLSKNSDGSYDIIIDFSAADTEFAGEIFRAFKSGNLPEVKNQIDSFIKKQNKNIKIGAVKLVLAGALIGSIAFSSFSASAAFDYSLGYLYFGTTAQQEQYALRPGGDITTVSPSYFDISSDGKLVINTISTSFVNKMHQNGKKVVPFLSNHWNREAGRTALKNHAKLAEDLAGVIATHNLDGINVDIENVTETSRADYTALVKRLRELIPSHKEVSVAVAANPKSWNTGWHGSYDYAALGQYATHLMIMAYDESYQGGPSGAVASASFIENSIKYALKYVPANKIVLGLPFFGRIWGESFNGQGVAMSMCETIIHRYGASTWFDESTKSPVAQINVTDDSTTINGKRLTQGTYTLHYENAASIAHKLSIAEKYNLLGFGAWALGQETDDVWQVINRGGNVTVPPANLPSVPPSSIAPPQANTKTPSPTTVKVPSKTSPAAQEDSQKTLVEESIEEPAEQVVAINDSDLDIVVRESENENSQVIDFIKPEEEVEVLENRGNGLLKILLSVGAIGFVSTAGIKIKRKRGF